MTLTREEGKRLSLLKRQTELKNCRACQRLVAHMATITPRKLLTHSDYWNHPVAGFGDLQARICLVGLAPGAHGANRTGRPFTGDGAGDFMYPLLHAAGFTNQPESYAADDGLRLIDLYITNAVKCLPPGNKPKAEEFRNCRNYLAEELHLLKNLRIVIALGRDAHVSILHLFKEQCLINRLSDYPFVHGLAQRLADNRILLSCYHTSRYNVQTGRMTKELFCNLLTEAKELLSQENY